MWGSKRGNIDFFLIWPLRFGGRRGLGVVVVVVVVVVVDWGVSAAINGSTRLLGELQITLRLCCVAGVLRPF